MNKDAHLIWENYAHSREFNMLMEQLESPDILEEGKFKDWWDSVTSKGNDLLARTLAKKDELMARVGNKLEKYPEAKKAIEAIANPDNIKTAATVVAFLAALAGGSALAIDALEGWKENQAAEAQLNTAIGNVAQAQQDLEGSVHSPGFQQDVMGINYNLEDFQQFLAGTGLEQEQINNVLNGVKFQQALDLSQVLGVEMSSSDQLVDRIREITNAQGEVQVLGEEKFLTHVKTSVTGVDGKQVTLWDQTTEIITQKAGGTRTIYEKQGGLQIDLINMIQGSVRDLEQSVQDDIWRKIQDMSFSNDVGAVPNATAPEGSPGAKLLPLTRLDESVQEFSQKLQKLIEQYDQAMEKLHLHLAKQQAPAQNTQQTQSVQQAPGVA